MVRVGSHTITITATDGSNNSQSVTTTFTVVAGPSFTVSVTPSTVKRGNKVTLKTAFKNCATSRQTLQLKVSLTKPSSSTLMATLPIVLQAGQAGSLSIPLTIPNSTPTGLYSLTLDVYVGGTKIGTSTAQLTVTL